MPSVWPSLLAFVVVIALIPVALSLVKRAHQLRPQRHGVLNLVGALPVGPRERIAVVTAGEKWLVVGITPQSINLLAALDQAPDMPAEDARRTAGGGFAQLLASMKKNA